MSQSQRMPQSFTILFGKAIRSIARLRGGGSALPGLFVEKVSPQFVATTLAQLPYGVVVISGTNGKTTTTKMVVALLEAEGMKVFTNRTGSNFVRGIAAALLEAIDIKGNLTADIAVLELDEAHAVRFVETIKPRYSLLLNVMRDQLDRFGEIDTTARLLKLVAKATTHAVVLNREDARIASIASSLQKSTRSYFFGLAPHLRNQFPNDDELHNSRTLTPRTVQRAAQSPAQTTAQAAASAQTLPPPLVNLENFTDDNKATFLVDGTSYTTPLRLRGIYNIYNSAAALALVKTILPSAHTKHLLKSLSQVTPAFGRGETLLVGGQPLELVLVKNPAGFRLSLASYNPTGYATMIAINDNYADGRDMSWLWDVDFTSLGRQPHQSIFVTGIRAYDMALRLQYDEVPVWSVEPHLTRALQQFISQNSQSPKRIYCTYTAMLALRKELSKITKVEDVL